MGFYREAVLPFLCYRAMRNPLLVPYRTRIAGAAEGRVLEIGVGSGANLPFYGTRASEILALEPSPRLIAMARRSAGAAAVPVTFINATGEALPIDDESIDTVITTWTLCTIPQASDALSEWRRVLRPRGRLVFVEHGLAPDENVRRWQHRLTPLWERISGGCHLDRPIQAMVEGGGFRIERLETGYIPGPKPLNFMYEGSAIPR